MRDLNEEERQKVRSMDVESRAKFVFCYLKEILSPDAKSERFYFCFVVLRQNLFPQAEDSQQYSDNAKLLETIILLERRGLVARDLPYPWLQGNRKKFMIHLTSIGVKSDIDDEVFLLVDKPEEIVDALEQKVGDLDEVVRQYYLESLRAYQEELYISSVICLGAASERAIHCLAGAIQPLSKKYQENIEKQRNISDLTKYLSGVLFNIFDDEKRFAKELKELLDELGQLYRKNRNDAGHPETVEQTSWLGQGQAGRLDLFRRYITTICEAIQRLKKQSAS